jgi:Family of unknown function (DUF6502)
MSQNNKHGLTQVKFGIIFPKMNNDAHALLAAAVTRLLRPLVKLLLRNGVAYGTFAELARKVYVDVAFDDYNGSRKRPSVSSVAALTGLTRKETKRLREIDSPKTVVEDQRYNRSVRVISGWINDPQYQEQDGMPADLPIEGGANSFSSLVKKYSGDIPSSAMLSVLEAANCVNVVNGSAQLLQHAYIPEGEPDEKINILGNDVAELIATIDHNLISSPENLRFQRKVSNVRIDPAAVAKFQQLSARKAQRLLEELDAWLSKHEVDENLPSHTLPHYVALGIYFTEHPSASNNLEN